MRRSRTIIAAAAVAVLAAGGISYAAAGAPGSHHAAATRGDGAEQEQRGGPQAPADYLDRRFTSNQPVTQAEIDRGVRQAAALSSGPGTWKLVGPSNIGARITDLAPDPGRPGTVYIAASGGGVWKSSDTGATFHPAWPTTTTQTIGSLAMGSDRTLWAGTGEANPSGGGLTFFGNGIYKSTDGGAHWSRAGLAASGAIGRIAVDPANPKRVFAAASGNLSGTAGQRGIYRLNADNSWQLVLPTPNVTTGGIDIAIDPANPARVFAALWDHHRDNGARVYGGVGSGLFRSTDGGSHWSRLQNVIGTASTDANGSGLRRDPSLGRIGVALAPGDPNRVYVVTGTRYGLDKGFYVSDDGGNSFRPGGHAGGDSGYEWWFGRIWVDPKNKNHLFNADVSLRESTDGGKTWHLSSGVHADQHAMSWDPDRRGHPYRVYVGNDGGFYRSESNGQTNTWIHATYEPFNQSYHLAVAADDPRRLATGLQDNGSVRTWTDTAPPQNLSQWNAFGGGDGHEVLIDYTNHNIYYECYQVGNCHRHVDANGTQIVTAFGPTHSTRITTDAPVILDPTNHNVVYFGGNRLDRSTNGGKTFTAISPPGDYLTGPVPPDERDKGPFYGGEYGTITWIAPAKTAPNTIYVGTDTGNLWKTTDLGKHWSMFSHRLLPTRWVNAIVVDRSNADHVFVAYSGYREGDLSANVWETTNGGRTWHNISGLLPNAPVEMLTYDLPHQELFAATDLGVFYAKDGTRAWKRVGSGLPNTPALDVKITGDDKTLYAATFGRSVWKVPLPSR
ncbi:MAG: glycosyl hydrolase [Pseudonocardiales bacterium]|nr:MAG: glycosyl hydrolase [Pseudonocardiales bacterium]